MLLIDIHQLDIILAQPVAISILKDQIDNIRCILRLKGQDILVLGTSQYFHERTQVDAESNVAIAAEWGEGLGFEHHGDEGNVGIVHGLESDAGIIAVEVAVLDQVFDGIDNLNVLMSLEEEVPMCTIYVPS